MSVYLWHCILHKRWDGVTTEKRDPIWLINFKSDLDLYNLDQLFWYKVENHCLVTQSPKDAEHTYVH